MRRAAERDADAAADLWLRARRAAVGAIPPPVHDDAGVRGRFASHVVKHTELWLAEDAGGEVAGLLVLDDQWLDQLYVEPTMTGSGIGSRLVELAKRERPDRLRLWTFASNVGAQRFYERHGFVALHRTDGRDNEEQPRARANCRFPALAHTAGAMRTRGRPGTGGRPRVGDIGLQPDGLEVGDLNVPEAGRHGRSEIGMGVADSPRDHAW